jgi:uncharacterized protein (TIGR02145 family)
MKKMNFLFLLAGMLSLSVMGQKSTITLTFTSAYYQGTYVPLDSIRVTNVTQGMDTVLYYPDTVLVLESNVGIPGYKMSGDGFRVIQNRPNPSTGQTKINIFVPEKGKVGINITDVGGRSLLRSDWQLDRGTHSFNFTMGETGLLFLTATWEGINSTIKILSEGTANPQNALIYAGFEGTGSNLKSNEQALGFAFNLGDSLIYIGYAQTPASIIGSDVLEDRPQSSKTYLFEIVEGIPCPGIPAVTYAGRTYTTVQIGTQCWFKENLNYSTGNSWCYNNNSSNCNTYGRLYDWQTALGACPSGWHLPSDAEWTALTDFLGGESIAGGKMKEAGTAHWLSPNTGATNSSGFTALPGGNRLSNGNFFYLTYYAHFWSSTELSFTSTWERNLYYNYEDVNRYYGDKTLGISSRCVHD